jgi:HEAT repeats
VLNKLLALLLLPFLTGSTLYAQDVEARFTTDKADYLIGEPVFVTLTVSNTGKETIWIDFESFDWPWICHDFVVETPESQPAKEPAWGCGEAGSCGRGFRQIPPSRNIILRQLLNREFSLQRLGAYVLRAHTTIVVYNQDSFDVLPIKQFEASDTLTINLQSSSESQLKVAFQPFVEELFSSDGTKRSEAADAITELAPPFLEGTLIEMTKSAYASAAIEALRKADTVKTRKALALIATGSRDPTLRIEAISNLGHANDLAYFPTLLQLVKSDDKLIQNAAAEAAGNLGGEAAFAQLASLVSSSDDAARMAGANGLGHIRARRAVPVLIAMLLDSNANVRQSAVSALSLLTHRVAFDGDGWSNVTSSESAADVHRRWVRWWNSHGNNCEIFGMSDCSGAEPLD